MSEPRHLSLVLVLLLESLVGGPPLASAGEAPPDSLRVYRLGEVLVTAPAPGLIAEPGYTEVPERVISRRDGGALTSLAQVIPATRVYTNSRGEALLAIRNANERQLGIFHDGIPMNVPWDDRVDASLVPTEAVGGLRVLRGFGSVHDGPNLIGGTVHMLSQDLPGDGSRTRLTLQGGEGREFRGSAMHLRRAGRWAFLGAGARTTSDGMLMPHDYVSEFNQSESRIRRNSDSRQTSLFLRTSRDLPRDGHVGLVLLGAEAARGVPPETHLESARYWRYPEWRRGMIALQGQVIPDVARAWRFSGSVALDRFALDIQKFSDGTFSAIDEVEEGRDRTVSLRMIGARRVTGGSAVSASVNARLTRHDERKVAGGAGASLEYAQDIWGFGLEWSGKPVTGWDARVGAGVDLARVTEAGDKPEPPRMDAPAVSFRVSREVGTHAQIHLAGGHRSRFPALREAFSEALGRFVPNPDLEPESQTTLELGSGWQDDRTSVAATIYHSRLEDGIIRASVEVDGQRKFQRINQGEARTFGLELAAGHRVAGWRFDATYSLQPTRVEEAGEFDGHAERAAEYTAYLGASGPIRGGLELYLERAFTGPSWSLDAEGDLRRLDSYQVTNVRLGYDLAVSDALGAELFARVNNVTDEIVLPQFGLPDAGREFLAGTRIEF